MVFPHPIWAKQASNQNRSLANSTAPLANPKMTTARIELMDRWSHGRASKPVARNLPAWAAGRIQRQSDLYPAPAGAFQAGAMKEPAKLGFVALQKSKVQHC
jgi:hypothetical protein